MSLVKSPEDLISMREGGRKLGTILQKLLDYSVPGISLSQIEAEANRLIAESGGTPSFKTVEGYRWATCLCINEVVVHGIPSNYKLVEGDVLTIDIGLLYKGFHTDTAWTKIIKAQNPKSKAQNEDAKEKFLQTGEEALAQAIARAKAGNRVGDISEAIQSTIEGAGYSIVKSLVGHGVGRELHEPPQIPGFVRGDKGNTPLLTAGMTIAIEVIYAQGSGNVVYANDDGWTIETRDRSLSAVFEHSVEITADGALVLTRLA